jgi:membrane-associated phospholipid phosphatase
MNNIRKKNLTVVLGILIFSFAFIVKSPAQTSYFQQYPYTPNKDYFVSYWAAIKKTATGPVRWKKQQWITFGGVVAGGTVLYIFDDDIRNFFQSHQSPALDKLSKYGAEPWGSGLYTLPFLGGFYLYGVAAKDTKARQAALAGTEAFVISGISVEIVKLVFGRHRPYQGNSPNPRKWEGPFNSWGYSSMPSGHTTVAFSVATVFASVYRDKPWVGILSYSIATGVGLSRIYDDKHWSSDVMIGAALGFAIGKTVYHVMEGKKHMSMCVTDNGIGLAYHL